MAIRKDVNDALNNLKKEEKQAKKAPSKYDGMSVDDLIGVIDSKSAPKPPVKKLRKLAPVAPKETSETAEKPVETEEKPTETAPKKKKKIVISGELPDYEALRQQEIETEKKPPEKKSETEKKNQDNKEDKKNFFERFKDMMYIAEDDEDGEPEEKNEKPKADFTIEEVKETDKVFQPLKEKAKSEEEKKSEKPRQESLPKKKKPESSEKNDSQAKKKSEGEKRSNAENKKKPPQSTKENTVSPPKKKKKKPAENIGATDVKEKTKKKADSEKDELQKNIEMAIAEFEKSMKQNEQKKAETPEKPIEVAEVATEKPKSEKKPSADVQPKKKQPTKPTNPPKSAEPAKRVQKDYTPDVNAPKTKLVGLVLVILSLIGLIAIINAVVSAVGGGKSANEDIKNAVYPAVIMDISTFENASQLSDDQIISATIWSVVMDKDKLSKYTQRANDMIVIPSADVSQYAIDLFGEEIPALTHTTVTTAEEKFYYNAETDCYNIQAQPDAHTYSPEVKDISKHGKDYTVDVEYIEEHAEWIDKSVAKTVRFELTKTSNGYRINSMELIG